MKITLYSGFMGALSRDGIEQTARQAVKAGCDSVEIFENLVSDVPLQIKDQEAAVGVRKKLQEQGLRVACYSAYANVWECRTGASGDNAEEKLKKSLAIAAELGSPYLHHTLLPGLWPTKGGPDFETAIRRAVEVVAKVADQAKMLGITCIYEDQGQYVNGVDGFGAFYWALKKQCSNVGVCADLGNILFVNEEPEAFLRAYRDEIVHVHVKDYVRRPATHKGLAGRTESSNPSPGEGWLLTKDGSWLYDAELGSGVIDLRGCVKLLQSFGYEGAYALEIPVREPYWERTQNAVQYLKEIGEQR